MSGYSELMTRDEVAEYLRTPKRTVERWAYTKTGPPYARVGHRTIYRRSDVDEWLSERIKEAA